MRWDDVVAVLGPRIVDARNYILAYFARFSDRFNREEMEDFRKGLYEVLTRVSEIGSQEVLQQNKRMAKYMKASAEADPDRDYTIRSNSNTSLQTMKAQSKPI